MKKGKKNLTFDLVRELLHQEEEKNKKLKEENEYRKSIADVLPEGEGHIAEETIQDLQKENKNLKEGLEDVEKIIEYYKNDKKLMNKQIKKLKEELSKYKKQYQHSMGFSDFGGYDEDEHIVKDENTYRDLDL